MKSGFYLPIIAFALVISLTSSCTLSTQQEARLAKDLSAFIMVRNEGDALAYLNLMHPTVVKYYRKQSDSAFIQRFQEVPKKKEQHMQTDSLVYWDKGYVKYTTSDDSLVQAKIEISLFRQRELMDSVTTIYALSSSNKSNWLFVSESDYFSILPKELQLFEE